MIKGFKKIKVGISFLGNYDTTRFSIRQKKHKIDIIRIINNNKYYVLPKISEKRVSFYR